MLAEQQRLEKEYVMSTYGRKPVELVSGKGMIVVDDQGKEYLDFVGGIAADSLGHCHPALVEALKSQAEKLIHVSNYYYIEGRGELAQMLSELLNDAADPDEATPWKTFFANSGAEANECAIKLARLFARRKAEAEGKAPESAPRTIVTLGSGFHGRTLATLAATAQPVKQEIFQPLPDGFVFTQINDIDALCELFAKSGDQICAVMVECVQGESGVHPCTFEYLSEVRRLADEYGALLICDEVQCGIYRCGTYPFGFQHFGVLPDIVTMAKGLGGGFPLGACSATEEVANCIQPGEHGSTFGGSCLAIQAATTVLRELDEGGYAQKVASTGAHLRKIICQLDHVLETRGIGLMCAVTLDNEVNANDVVARALERGILLNATGANDLRFIPPLICTKEDVNAMVSVLKELLAE